LHRLAAWRLKHYLPRHKSLVAAVRHGLMNFCEACERSTHRLTTTSRASNLAHMPYFFGCGSVILVWEGRPAAQLL